MVRVLSIFMSVLLLISSTRVQLDFHHCSGHIKSWALFSKAKSCDHQKNQKHKSHSGCPFHDSTSKDDCCGNTHIQLESIDLQTIVEADLLNFEPQWVNVSDLLIKENITQATRRSSGFSEYFRPPRPSPPIIILHQQFLI